jgi:hypothetical protein
MRMSWVTSSGSIQGTGQQEEPALAHRIGVARALTRWGSDAADFTHVNEAELRGSAVPSGSLGPRKKFRCFRKCGAPRPPGRRWTSPAMS